MKAQYHVVPWKNWCNDPNGLIYDGVDYHVFYQHYPYAHNWGPMHWGHATSKDLYRWKHEPIALFPDNLGSCYSGSAVMDFNNSSGLKKDGRTPMILFYTSHPAEPADDGHAYEMQSMAYSYDGIHFMPYENNPILENNGKADFRDPKVIWYEADACWVMVLAAGDHIAFYRSDNLIDWTHSGDFGPGENNITGVWECPDLFRLTYDGGQYWVLIVSMGTDIENGKSITQYFIGSFDGKHFTSLEQTNYSRLIDDGPDNYAAVGFFGVEEPVMLGWAVNWGYAADTPTSGWVGQMTAARRVSLYRDRKGHISLASIPADLPDDAIKESRQLQLGHDPRNQSLETILEETALTLEFKPSADDPSFEIKFSNDEGDVLVISQAGNRDLTVDRTQAGNSNYNEMLKMPIYQSRTVEARTEEIGEFIIMLDGPLLEVYADNGSRVVTMVVYPSKPYKFLTVNRLQEVKLNVLKAFESPRTEDFYVNQVD